MAAEGDSRLQKRLEREHRARLQAEGIAEAATRDLYVTIQDLRRTSDLVTMLQKVAVAANEAATIEEAAAAAIDEVCALTGWPIGHLYVVDEPGHIAPTGIWHLDDPDAASAFRRVTEASSLFKGEGLPGRVLESGRPAWIPDVTKDENFPRSSQAVDIGVRAGFGFPVTVATEVVAVLEFFTIEAREPDEALLGVMANIGTQLGRVVERDRAQEALQSSERQVRTIIDTANDAFISIDTDGRITEWNRQAEHHFGWTRDDALGRMLTGTIIPLAHRQAHSQGIARFLESGAGPVLGRRVELEAVRQDGRVFPIELTPWAVTDGEVVRFHAFIHDITERKAFERQLEHQSLHDPLTGLPNRALLLDRLRHALRRARRAQGHTGVLFIDLDRFKAVNDSLGHEGGDRLLLGVADRIPGVLRGGDTLARLGGDEFVVLCEELSAEADAVLVADRVLAALETPFQIGTTEVHVSASIGVAIARAEDIEADELLADADLAMYKAKERGKGVQEVFDEAMRSHLVQRLDTEKALRQGIEQGELVAHYQPVIDLQSRMVIGMEALVRWRHPERGLLPPLEFVGLAEETGLIGRIGEWMITQACWQARRWHERFPTAPPLWVAVNLSVRELEQPRLVDDVVRLLAANSLPPESLMLEVTESVVMDDAQAVMRRLWELKELGVRLAIDDFGTGYSSLDRLRRMPFEMLKIDRSFIADIDLTPGGTSLVAAVIAMSHSLGLGVIAEGVETMEQLVRLRGLGCDSFQGFLVGWPAPAPEVDALLAAGNPAISPPDGPDLSTADLEAEIMRIVSQALSDRVDVERTTRSLLAELRRLAGLIETA